MAAPNTEPVFTRVADIQWVENITAANTTFDLTSGTSYLAYTADATNGGYVTRARIKANPTNNFAATVVRFWLNNGAATTTAANSALIGELTFAATTASANTAQIDHDFPLGIAMPPGYRIYVTIGTAPTSPAKMTVTVFGGKY
jgi:hypothetical protein